MIALDQIRAKVKSLVTHKGPKTIAGLGEALGSPKEASRQAKSDKVAHTIKSIANAFRKLRTIAQYLDVPLEFLILNEEVYRKLWERGKAGHSLASKEDQQLYQLILALKEHDRRIMEPLLERLIGAELSTSRDTLENTH
ncbi:MAG: hypothetical protein GY807_06170 [Gammaproteobacteria bacterium]|nr:hypothetical protein [Gammaproteobacteria bacterium]